MQLKLTNKNLLVLKVILGKVAVHNMRANRGRVKLLKRVTGKLEEYSADEKDILSSFAQCGEDGNFVYDDNGQLVLQDGADIALANQQLVELGDEEVVIESGEYTARFTDFFDFLADCNGDFTIEEIVLIDDLLDQFETQAETTEEK